MAYNIRFYTDLFNQRNKGDYDAFVEFESVEVEDMFTTGKEFISEVREH